MDVMPKWAEVILVPLISLLLAAVLSALVILSIGEDPVAAVNLMVKGAPRTLTDGATHYHTKAVSPKWSRKFARTTTIGVHHFYRMPTRVSSN